MTPGGDGSDPVVIFATVRPVPEQPVLVTGTASAALLNGAGEFSFEQETRGAPIDWGGVYGQGIRLTGPWPLTVISPSGRAVLGRSTLLELRHDPGGLVASHRVGGLVLRETVATLYDRAGVERRLFVPGPDGDGTPVSVETTFDPQLAPVLIEGVKPDRYRLERQSGSLVLGTYGFAARITSVPGPSAVTIGGEAWDGEPVTAELRGLTLRWEGLRPDPGAPALTVLVEGGLERTLKGHPAGGVPAPEASSAAARAAWAAWLSNTPSLEFPDAPGLTEAYGRARRALRMLYTAPEPGFEGMVAGYPWYSALWCRDLAWMVPALEWMGDFDWVGRSIATVLRFQAGAHLPILGARAGELPMQVSPGPLLLYGTSDTSLYYPSLVARHLRHSGSLEACRRWLPAIERILALGVAASHPQSGLFTNGGELAEMRRATALGPVHVGFDAVDTTIWDSTDRRDHAIDVQVLWVQALEAATAIGRYLGRPIPGMEERADRVRATVLRSYAWPDEQYLYDSVRHDGRPVAKLRPNALRVVSAGWLPTEPARAIVRRAAQPDLSTPWGVRTLSSKDPGYTPTAYHDGQVWPIATAWAADAALRCGERELALGYLRTIAGRLAAEGGYANECYRGDRAEPFDSCFLLGFSVAPFLSTLFESLWGLAPHAGHRTLEVRPRFPRGWQRARLHGLRLGGGTVSLDWSPRAVEVRWSGPEALELSGESGECTLGPGSSASLPLPPPD